MVSLLGIGLVERFRADLELQVFHQFEDVVVALVYEDVLVTNGVVALLIVEVE